MRKLTFEIQEQNLLLAIDLSIDPDERKELEKHLVALYDAYYGEES